MRPIISVRRRLTQLAMLVMLPAVAWAQTNEAPVKKLEILWEFDTGG